MFVTGRKLWVVCLLAWGLVLAGCGAPTSEPDLQPTRVAEAAPSAAVTRTPTHSPTLPPLRVPTQAPTPLPTETRTPTPTPLPTDAPTATATPVPIQLVVLHTNDNWGETEPCG